MKSNLIPTIFIGLIESHIINKSNNNKIIKKGLGVLINTNTILLSSLLLSHQPNSSSSELDNDMYQLERCVYYPIGIPLEYKYLLPNQIISEKVIIVNDALSILISTFNIGDVISYILQKENKNKLPFINPYPRLKSLSDDDIQQGKIMFFEGKSSSIDNQILSEEIIETYYNIKLSSEVFLLEDKKNYEKFNILPGIILVYQYNTYYITGFISDSYVNIEKNEDLSSSLNNNEENEENDVYKLCYRIQLKQKKEIDDILNRHEIQRNTYEYNKSIVSSSINFDYIDYITKESNSFPDLIRDNAYKLYQLTYTFCRMTKIKPESIFTNHQLYCLILFNRTLDWTNNEKIKKLDFSSMNISVNGSFSLGLILKNTFFEEISLKNNSIFSQGLKKMIETSFLTRDDQGRIFSFKDLKHLNMDNNKLSSKSIKYLRHIIKSTDILESISLKNNSLTYLSLKYLLNSFENKGRLQSISLSSNIFSHESGKYFQCLISKTENLNELHVENNCLGDKGIVYILKALSKMRKRSFHKLNLSKNCFGDVVVPYLVEFLGSVNEISYLNISGNSICDEGLLILMKNIRKTTKINELHMSNCQFTILPIMNEENLIKKLNLSLNSINDNGIQSIYDYIIKNNYIESINLAYNKISSIGANLISNAIINNSQSRLKELKLNSNLISNDGGESLLSAFSVSCLLKLHVENNFISWREDLIDIRSTKENSIILY